MREWYTSRELIEVDGLPNSLEGISHKAKRDGWLRRKASGQGRSLEYHISNFSHDVKIQLIEKLVTDSDEAKALLQLGEPSVYDMDPVLKRKLIRDLDKLSHKNIQAMEKETEEAREEIVAITAATKNLELLLGERKLIHMPNIAESKLIHQLDMCPVPVFNVYAACGWGAENSAEYQIRTEFVPCQWLSRFGLGEDNARIITCQGDSMEDTLSDGDEVLVDIRELEHPVKHGVYVVRIGKHVYIKRLKYDIMAEGYEVISDNKELYPSFIVNGDKLQDLKVIGKVVTTVMKAVV